MHPVGAIGAGCQIHDGEALERGVVAVAIGSDAPIGVGVSHGWREDGEPMFVSRTLGRSILTLDDAPALDAYLRRFDAPPEVAQDPDAFAAIRRVPPARRPPLA